MFCVRIMPSVTRGARRRLATDERYITFKICFEMFELEDAGRMYLTIFIFSLRIVLSTSAYVYVFRRKFYHILRSRIL